MLASFALHAGWPTIWYSIGDGADDPLVFLVHLVYACRTQVPGVGTLTLTMLEKGTRSSLIWREALDGLLNDLVVTLEDDTILVLDDFHVVDEAPAIRELVDHMLRQLPPMLHVVIGSRRWPPLPVVSALQVRRELASIDEGDLRFSADEIEALFSAAYEQRLTGDQAHTLSVQTGGWAIALQLMSQRATQLPMLTEEPAQHLSPQAQELLFEYLASDVLAQQPAEVQTFLLRAAVLEELDPQVCDAVLEIASSAATLRKLERQGLFLSLRGAGVYSFHPLFHAFLTEQGRVLLPDWEALHRRAAAYFRQVGTGEQALGYLHAIADNAGLALELERVAPALLASSRFMTLRGWVDQLPAPLLTQYPALEIARGDVARLMGQFPLAKEAYANALALYDARGDRLGQARALQGQALVYLDTVEPAVAHGLLRRAYKLAPPREVATRAALLRLIAENRVNQGRAAHAIRLYRLATLLDGQHDGTSGALYPRIYLRLGQLEAARSLLEETLAQSAVLDHQRPPAAHREVTVLLSLLHALCGNGAAALREARHGLQLASEAGSVLFQAIAHIRLGHALQLIDMPELKEAEQHYRSAMTLADTLQVERTKAEAYLGLVLLYGHGGNIEAACEAAGDGLAIAERSGDAWTTALLWTALGGALVACGDPEALPTLRRALHSYEGARDTYGQAVVRLWLAVHHQKNRQPAEAARELKLVLELVERHGYHGLFTAPSLFGPRDRMMVVPLLVLMRPDPHWHTLVGSLLRQRFPVIAADSGGEGYCPGWTLRIKVLGQFRVFRGSEEIPTRAWQRRKARELLALLVTERRRWLLREQIYEYLWPDLNESEAESQFKVTLNALQTALEPHRPPRVASYFVRRNGSSYRFCPPDGLELDVDLFEARSEHALPCDHGDAATVIADLEAALALYTGDYLEEFVYDEWTQPDRNRLATRFLEAATTLAILLMDQHRHADVVQVCEMILQRDPSWEDAYRLMMLAFLRQGSRHRALATYDRCVKALMANLGVDPVSSTTEVYEAAKA
ncbi:MAG: BTAD domain-containing putative transcriptional regulator [Herpetosiphon sp.]